MHMRYNNNVYRSRQGVIAGTRGNTGGIGNNGLANVGLFNVGDFNIGIGNYGAYNLGIGLTGTGQIGIGGFDWLNPYNYYYPSGYYY